MSQIEKSFEIKRIFFLNLFRQEMQHFVRVMQSYIAHQVIFVTWNEFKASLKTDLNNLDDLIKIHDDYLNRAIFRSAGFSTYLTNNLLPFYYQKLSSKFLVF